MKVRVLTRELALKFHDQAWADGRDEHGDRLVITILPDDKIFPVDSIKRLPDGDYRCLVACSGHGDSFLIDLTEEELESLPWKDLKDE